jgi:peroxiredoxin
VPLHVGPVRPRRGGRVGDVLSPGGKAPPFTLLDQAANTVKLSNFKGRKVLVYFYSER